jgi:predicted Zn-dependent peptidase
MINKTVLGNGVRIVTEKVPAVHSVTIGFWVKTGSRHENGSESGLAHFIEHMLFKGTDKRNACEIARVIDSVGGSINAFTSKEYTCFYVKVLSQHLSLAVDLLCDIFFNSVFDEEEIEKERNVIFQEISMVHDTPDDYIQDLFIQSYFDDHPLASAILGVPETVQAFKRKDILDFFDKKHLVPQNIIISVAGNIEHEEVLDEIVNRFEHLKGSDTVADNMIFTPERKITYHFRELEQVHVCMGSSGYSQVDDRRYALYILNAVLGGSMSSRLFQEIRENQGLAYSVYSYVSSFADTGLFGVYMGIKNENLKDALAIVMREFNKTRDVEITGSEFTDAKEQIKGNMLLSLESSDSRMSRIARSEIYYDEYVPIEDIIAKVDAVKSEEVKESAIEIFNDDLFTFTFLGPTREEDIPPETTRL